MTALGQTLDPTDLVPGDAESVRAIASGWRRAASALDETGSGLTRLDTGSWSGAAAQAFTDYSAHARPVWLGGSDALADASSAVTQYASTLEWGQDEARTAITMWQQSQQTAAVARLTAAQAQVCFAGDQAATAVRAAIAAAPTASSALVSRLLDSPTAPTGNLWDQLVGAHPEPGSITADSAEVHILYGGLNAQGDTIGGHLYGSGVSDKTVFPESWTPKQIMAAVVAVANDPDQVPSQDQNGVFKVSGTYNGVLIEEYIYPDGTVGTAYPVEGPGVCVNDKYGEPVPLPSNTHETAAQSDTEDGTVAAGQAAIQAQADVEAQQLADAAAAARAQAAAAARAQALAEAQAEAMAEAQAEARALAQAELEGLESE